MASSLPTSCEVAKRGPAHESHAGGVDALPIAEVPKLLERNERTGHDIRTVLQDAAASAVDQFSAREQNVQSAGERQSPADFQADSEPTQGQSEPLSHTPLKVPGDDLREAYIDLAGGVSAINRRLAINTLKLAAENDVGREPPSDAVRAAHAPPAAPLRSDDIDDFMAEPEDENESDFWIATSKGREGVSQRSSIPMTSRAEPSASEKVQYEQEMSSAVVASNDGRTPWSEDGIAREIRRPKLQLGTTVLARQKMVAGLGAILLVLAASGIVSISRDGSDIDQPDRQYSSTAVNSVDPVAGKLPSRSDQPFLMARRGEAERRSREPAGAMPRLPCSLHRVTEQNVTPSPQGRAGEQNHVGDMIFYRFHEKDGPCAVITNDITGSNLPKSERGWIADGRTELTEGSESQIGVDVDEVIATIEQEGYYVGSLGSTKHPGKPAGSKLIRLF